MDNEELEKNEENTFNGSFHERDSQDKNDIVQEIKDSFLDYSMSVITSRAIPDLRDGLKPVHRRILWSMFEDGNTPDKPHKKSATTVGYVMGHYHPHGDSSIYEAMVRLAQWFNQRYTLVDGHGNFGNIDGDGAAAYRYTEARLSKISLEMLRDIRKETVDMMPNFDETSPEPTVLPSRIPNLLVNGSMGIAVGMATNIPPHNLGEVIDACVAYMDNNEITVDEIMQYIKGPDFPTGAIILGNSGIKKAYETGKGSITIRSRAHIEEKNGKHYIIVDEVPYGVNTYELKNKVAELVRDKVIEGISEYHTDLKNGVKITMTLKKDANPQVVLNNLYKHTSFQVNYGINMLVIDKGTPRTLDIKSIISKYIDHQKEVIYRRTKFDLQKAEERTHILEGLKIALDNIDEVVRLIRASKSDQDAKEGLITKFGLDDIQAQAILDMRLRRLTGLERDKIEEELDELHKLIAELKEILASEEKVIEIIKNEMLEIKEKYSDERRTTIDMTAIDYIEDESLIPVENILIALTNKGYIKRVTDDNFKIQNRGGVGIKGMTTNDDDFPEKMISMTTHDYILFFSNYGKVYSLKGYEIPEFSRQSKGLPIVNLLPIEKDEKITSMLMVKDGGEENKYLVFITKKGIIKRTLLSEFDSIRKNGKKAIVLKEDDELINVGKSDGTKMILIGADNGKMIRFSEEEVRVMGRSSSGVKGIEIDDSNNVVGAAITDDNKNVLVVTENGYGKQTQISEYRITHRGSKGVKALNTTEKTGNLVGFKVVEGNEDLIIISSEGIIIRIDTTQISSLSRNTQGVKLINLKDNQKVATVTTIVHQDDEEQEEVQDNNTENVEITENTSDNQEDNSQ